MTGCSCKGPNLPQGSETGALLTHPKLTLVLNINFAPIRKHLLPLEMPLCVDEVK